MSDFQQRDTWLPISLKKSIPPFSLDPTLTFYCPQENVEAFDHPAIAAFHTYLRSEYQPPAVEGEAVLLLLPCTKTKPYTLSKEHLAVNHFLLELGFKPRGETGYPPELAVHLPEPYSPETIHTGPLVRDGLTIHRMVVSEPMGLVPYEDVYFWRGELSPASRYDDPGLFEHRGTAVCLWRPDHTAKPLGDGKYGWGPAERAAYVKAHNYLSELIAVTLHRLRPHYRRIVAYVSPKLTHRSFLTNRAEKQANGIPRWKATDLGRESLVGVNDRVPGLVDVTPSATELLDIKTELSRRLAEAGENSPGRVQAYFASGGGGATPLILPEALAVLKRHLIG